MHIELIDQTENTKKSSSHETDNLPEKANIKTVKQCNRSKRDLQDNLPGKTDINAGHECLFQSSQKSEKVAEPSQGDS